MIIRVSRELGRPCRLHRDCGLGAPAYQLQVDPRLSCPELVGTNRGQTDGIAKRRKRSAARWTAGSRSATIVVLKRGNGASRTPWSEGGAALWAGSWNHAEDVVPHQRVTAKPPSRVRDSDSTSRRTGCRLTCTSGSVGAPGSNPWGDPACTSLDRAIGRPRCSFDRGFTVTLPEPWPPAGRYTHAESGERGCPVLYEYQSAPPRICTMRWGFTGANTKRSGGDPQLSPSNFFRADPRSRYGRKPGFLPQVDWPVHPDALPVRPVT